MIELTLQTDLEEFDADLETGRVVYWGDEDGMRRIAIEWLNEAYIFDSLSKLFKFLEKRHNKKFRLTMVRPKIL